MKSFGISKNKPVKPLQILLNVTTLKLALSAKCFIYIVVFSYFIFLPVCQSALAKSYSFAIFWFVCWLKRIANVYGFMRWLFNNLFLKTFAVFPNLRFSNKIQFVHLYSLLLESTLFLHLIY